MQTCSQPSGQGPDLLARETLRPEPLAGGQPLPGPRGWAWLRACRALLGDPFRALSTLIARHGDVFGLCVGGQRVVVVSHPGLADEVLRTQAASFRRSSSYRKLATLLGPGLLSLEGEAWRRHRRAAQPAFSRERVAAVTERLSGVIGEGVARWEADAGRDGVLELDLMDAVLRLSLEAAVHGLLGVTATPAELDALVGAMTVRMGVRHTDRRRWLSWLPGSGARQAERDRSQAAAALVALATALISRREAQGAAGVDTNAQDLLGSLLVAERTGALTRDEVVHEVLHFLAAGHETAAYALTWTFYLLAQRPQVQGRLALEVADGDAAVEGGPAARGGRSLVRRVVLESLRIYPPVWAIEREALEDTELGGYRIPAGSTVIVGVHAIQNDPALWSDPARFDPERFHPEAAAQVRDVYLPFGRGQRQCVGEGLALVEMQLVLSAVLRAFSVELALGEAVVPKGGVTLRPRDGLRVRLRLRRPAVVVA